jgi:hypothetical protein
MRTTAEFHPELFSKMLAKIAHSFAVGARGLNGFQPLLPAGIIGKERWCPGYLAGGEPGPILRSDTFFEINLRDYAVGNIN